MTQQQAMENILKQWVLTSSNLHHLERTMGKGWESTEGARIQKNKLGCILSAHGFVYRVVTEPKESVYETDYIFRKKPAKNYAKVHQNWLAKHYGHEWVSSDFKIIEM